jgi:hypothetical protein
MKMKVRLNKQTLASMDSRVRNIVSEWKAETRRNFISVENRQSFGVPENARVTMLNLSTGAAASAQAAGDFAGYTNLSPCATIPLPIGVVAIVREIFLGQHFLTIYQGSP